MNKTQFEFKGDGMTYLLYSFATPFLIVFTLYFGMPWIYCWKKRWVIGNCYVNNRKLIFTGNGAQALGLFMKIFFGAIFTLGIYIPFGIISIKKWELRNTFFEDEIYPARTAQQYNNDANKIYPVIDKENGNLLLEEPTNEDGLEFTCFKCHTQLELNKEETKEGIFICPVCKTENKIYAEQSAELVKDDLMSAADIPEKDYTCISCSSIVTLEGDELLKDTYICPVCSNTNKI